MDAHVSKQGHIHPALGRLLSASWPKSVLGQALVLFCWAVVIFHGGLCKTALADSSPRSAATCFCCGQAGGKFGARTPATAEDGCVNCQACLGAELSKEIPCPSPALCGRSTPPVQVALADAARHAPAFVPLVVLRSMTPATALIASLTRCPNAPPLAHA